MRTAAITKVRQPRVLAGAFFSNILKNSAEYDVKVFAITAPKGGIDANDDAIVGVEAEPEPVVALEIRKIEIGATVRHFARIIEEGTVEATPDLPAVFALKQDRVRCLESILTKTAKRVVTTQRRHVVERNRVLVGGVGRRDEEPCRDDATSGEEADELPEIGVQPIERICSSLSIVVV